MLNVAVLHPFSLLYRIPLKKYITKYLFIYSTIDEHWSPSLFLVQKCYYAYLFYISLHEHIHAFLLDIVPRGEIAVSLGRYIQVDIAKLFPVIY